MAHGSLLLRGAEHLETDVLARHHRADLCEVSWSGG
jgi:hypothetical protein